MSEVVWHSDVLASHPRTWNTMGVCSGGDVGCVRGLVRRNRPALKCYQPMQSPETRASHSLPYRQAAVPAAEAAAGDWPGLPDQALRRHRRLTRQGRRASRHSPF